MQNLTKCTNRHFTIPRNTVLSSFSKALRDGDFSRKGCPHIVQPRRMFHPLSYHAYKHLQREFKAIRAILIRSQSDLTQYYDHLLKSRNFSSSSPQSSRGGDRGQPSSSDDPSNDDSKNNKDRDKLVMMVTKLLLFCALVSIFFTAISKFIYGDNTPEQQRFVSWNEFAHHMLAKGEVEQLLVRPDLSLVTIVLYDGAVFKGRRSDFKVYFMTVPDLDLFEEKLRETERKLGIKPEEGVPIIYRRKGSFGTILLPLAISLFILSKVMGKSGGFRGSFPMDLFSQMRRAKYTLIDPLTGTGKGVRFEDVAGLHEAKIEIMEFVDYLKRPEHYKVLGAKVPKGALLLGPPGCGKTLLAKAVATEAKVPFLSMNGSEFVEMIGGLGAARVRDLFTEGKKRAPSIIFIDEIDAIGGKRSESGVDKAASELEQTLNQLLVELDGMASREGVIVLASTNRAEVLDKALLRPGRFDRQILIDLPTLEERRQIFERHLKNIVLDDKPEAYSDRLARLSPGFSGADIANVCNEAALHAARVKKKKVDASDLSGAIDRVIGGLEKKDHAISPAEKKVVAYHESGHALTGWLLKHTDALLKITIVPRTNSVLGFAQYAPTDQKLHSKDELFEKMCMTLGGRVAESLIFNKISTGAQNDLTKVTKMAYDQVQRFGMSRNVGLLSFDENQTGTNTRKPYSKHLGNLIDIEARRMVGEAYRKTQELLSNNREKLELLAEELLAKETLSYEDIEKLIGPPPFGKKRLIAPATFEQTIRGKEESTPQPTPT